MFNFKTLLDAKDVLGSMAKRAESQLKEHLDPDVVLMHAMDAAIQSAKTNLGTKRNEKLYLRKGEPLSLMLAGYVGNRNTGADVRTHEMTRQFRAMFGDDHVDINVITLNKSLTDGYFQRCRQTVLPDYFPSFLAEQVPLHHVVIASEGSMFKSKFANALSAMMAGSLGLASAHHKIAVAYGGEAGAMDKELEAYVAKWCKDALLIARNTSSQAVLGKLGLETQLGVDTAWSFAPSPASAAERHLNRTDWDGETPLLMVCPINPYWWPVKPDPARYMKSKLNGVFPESHYRSMYFHRDDLYAKEKFAEYIRNLASTLKMFRRKKKCYPVLIAMERLDALACRALNEELGGALPMFLSEDIHMHDMVSILRKGSLLLSSRFHAMVCSMPAAVPMVGVTMDERISNLMQMTGTPDFSISCDASDLPELACAALENAWQERETLKAKYEYTVAENLFGMDKMGKLLLEHVESRTENTEFAKRVSARGGTLPELSPDLERIMSKYASAQSRQNSRHLKELS